MRRHAHGRAARELFAGLLDDAALFPPVSAPMREAVTAHIEHLRDDYADLVGPFVCPAAGWEEFRAVAPAGLEVSVVGNVDAIDVSAVQLLAVELAEVSDAPAVPLLNDVPVYVEVAFGDEGALDALVASGHRAKLLLGGLRVGDVSSDAQLAAALSACEDRGLPFKLDAGSLPAVRARDPRTGVERHGLLNVLVGLTEDDPAEALTERDPAVLAEAVLEVPAEVRALFLSASVSSVGTTVAELRELGLL